MPKDLQTQSRNGRAHRGGLDGAGPRFMLYSHDSAGLGHLRRNLTLAAALVEAFPRGMVLIVTGSTCATSFPLPERVEVVKLPSISKDQQGSYVSRRLPTSLEFTLRMRSGLLMEAMRTYQPDLMIVDHQVIGLHGEVLPLLERARATGVKTILGVRDIIDSPEAVAREWSGEDVRWALREAYDRVCVYGAPRVFDPRIEYPIPPELSDRLEFTGYVVRTMDKRPPASIPSLRPEVLVTTGGGEDGADRIEAYLECIESERPSWDSVIVTGPLLSMGKMRALARRARLIGSVELHRFHADLPRLLQRAHLVVAMAGYNTCAEILALGKRALLLPRRWPRREQEIRSERFAALGLSRSLPFFTAGTLRVVLEEELEREPTRVCPPPLDGARQVAAIASNLLDVPTRVAPRASRKERLLQ